MIKALKEKIGMFCQNVIVATAKTDCLTSIEIFNDLTEQQLALFESIVETVTVEKGTTVFKQDDKGDCLYIVKEGKVSMRFSLKVNTGTIRPIVQTAYRNGLFGELELLDSLPRTATAIAEEDTELIKIDGARFRDVIDNNPDAGYMVMKNFSKVLTSRTRRGDRQLQTALIMGWNAYKFDKY
jgi:CRP-like cAMP-binding protein